MGLDPKRQIWAGRSLGASSVEIVHGDCQRGDSSGRGPCRVGTAEARKRMKQRGAHEGLRDAGRWRITV